MDALGVGAEEVGAEGGVVDELLDGGGLEGVGGGLDGEVGLAEGVGEGAGVVEVVVRQRILRSRCHSWR